MSFILLIEDDRDIRETTLEFLSMENIEAIGFADAITALDYLSAQESRRPSLIITDINMPKMDGPTFRKSQLALPSIKDIPCVALSADPRADLKFADLNLAGILKKPIDLDQLLNVIQRYSGSVVTSSVEAATVGPNVPVDDEQKRQHDLINELSAAKMISELCLRSSGLPEPIRLNLERIFEKLTNALRISGAQVPFQSPPDARIESSSTVLAKSVLLLDDSRDLRDLFKAYLTPRGFKIQTAHDVAAAIEILKLGFPQLLLIDYHLGDSNVYDALDSLERECPEVFKSSKVVLFSATPETVSDSRIFAFEVKAQDLRGIEAVVQKYT